MLYLLYAGIPLPEKPVTLKQVAKVDRNAEIRARYTAGAILWLGALASRGWSRQSRILLVDTDS